METKPSLLDAIREAVRGPGWTPGRRAAGGRMPSLGGATGWFNSPPLTADGLRGRVVVVDFWTYTCINWLRSLPYVGAWAKKYERHGWSSSASMRQSSRSNKTSRTFAGPRQI